MNATDTISLTTKGFSDVLDITDKVTGIVEKSGIQNGLVTVFCPGPTGSMTTIEYESRTPRLKKKRISECQRCGGTLAIDAAS